MIGNIHTMLYNFYIASMDDMEFMKKWQFADIRIMSISSTHELTAFSCLDEGCAQELNIMIHHFDLSSFNGMRMQRF